MVSLGLPQFEDYYSHSNPVHPSLDWDLKYRNPHSVNPEESLSVIHQEIQLKFCYGVYFTEGLFQLDNSLLVKVLTNTGERLPKRMIVVVDQGVLAAHPQLCDRIRAYAHHYRAVVKLEVEPLVMPAGEGVKNSPHLVEQIQQTIEKTGLCRHSYVLAIGGGALLDMVGYAAATAHRGLRLIRIPTTVLAQNDSGVGVKNSVNAYGKKNFLGTFSPPYAVLNDSDFLVSLGDRDWRAGLAEAVKVALLKDAEFFESLAKRAIALAHRDLPTMKWVIHRCAQLHLQHIATSGDPFELGSSRPLDFGHWVAHKLEQLTDYRLRHGEAVAIGLALDCLYSQLQGWLSKSACDRILQTLRNLGFTLYVPELSRHLDQPHHPGSIFQGLEEFREHLGGELTLMLLKDIGCGLEVHSVERSLYIQAIAMLESGDI